ncbi:hypothetical protein SDC9_145927 [bioreactor metagenome]|uniref:Uncharacterized protein n=1 Tax=bioreactor metagenome TaxID=1076179 RepID=A0A645ECA3_9ZZZZ
MADTQPRRLAEGAAHLGIVANRMHRRSHEVRHRPPLILVSAHRMQHVALGQDADHPRRVDDDHRGNPRLDHQCRRFGKCCGRGHAVGVQGHQVGYGRHPRILFRRDRLVLIECKILGACTAIFGDWQTMQN